MRTLLVTLRSVLYMSGFALLWGWVAMIVRGHDSRFPQVRIPEGASFAGVILMLAGGTLALACIGTFILRGKGTPAPFDAPERFVATGPYRRVRNPMYIGGFFLLAGLGIYYRSPSILLFSLAWLLLFHLFVVFYEEPTLRSKFGAAYAEYCRRVPRWMIRL